jgi:putative oxidoreductase
MLDKITRLADLPARAAMSAIFILSALGKVSAFDMTQGYMEAFGVPGALLVPTIAFEFGAGMALLVGFRTRYCALLLAGFSLLAAAVFHRDFSDQIQQIMFLKNVAMAGGLLLLAKTGAPGQSIENLISRRRRRSA